MATLHPLTEHQLHAFLEKHPKWRVEGGHLTRVFHFPSFLDGIRFVDQVAHIAEAANHHPDIDVRYREVTLRLMTHDAGGLTEKDTKLAEEFGMVVAGLRPVKAAVPDKTSPPKRKQHARNGRARSPAKKKRAAPTRRKR